MSEIVDIHVCLVTQTAAFGGIERFAADLASWLLERGCRVTFLTDSPAVFAGRLPGDERLSVRQAFTWDDRPVSLGHCLAARREFRKMRPDAVLFNQCGFASYISAVIGARMAGVGKIVGFHHGTVDNAETFGQMSLLPPHDFWAMKLKMRYWLYSVSVNEMLFNNAANAHEGLRYYGPRAVKVHTTYLGVDVEEFRPDAATRQRIREQLRIPADAFAIGISCRLDGQKGEDIMLDAVGQLATRGDGPPLVAVLIGDGPRRTTLAQRAGMKDLEGRVRFAGFVDRPQDYLNALDAFTLLSNRESFGLALAEAMATGLPCVATHVGGMREIITDGQDGLFMRGREAGELAGLLSRIIGDEELRRSMGAAARETVVKRFEKGERLATIARYLGV